MANTHADTILIHSGIINVSPTIALQTQTLWQDILSPVDWANQRTSLKDLDGDGILRNTKTIVKPRNIFHVVARALSQLKSTILKRWKFLLPVVWTLHAASSFSTLSSTNLLASFALSVAPLVKTMAKKHFHPKLALHKFIRDSGLFGTMMDVLLTLSLPSLIIQQPTAFADFYRLGSQRKRIFYGRESPKQVLDMYMPTECRQGKQNPRGLIFFVHGGE